jgi:xanthine dehydrogenase YagS FAD-binding subunit
MHPFKHIDAPKLSTAIELLNKPYTAALAGGTDLLGELKRRIKRVNQIVNLKTISGLNKIRYKKSLNIGALVTVAEVEYHPFILKRFPMIAQAASFTATPQLRNMGTVAGNLCQHPRCWYYRNSSFHCWLKGGEVCFALKGENKYHAILGGSICHAVHASDLAPVLMALDSKVKIAGPKGNRWIFLEDLYIKPRHGQRQMTVLKTNELITEIQVMVPPKRSKGIYLKVMERKTWSFALVSVAAHLSVEGNHISRLRLVLGGVAPIPWRVKGTEGVLGGQRFSEGLVKSAAEAALADAHPLRDNGYKLQLTKALIQHALMALIDQT